MAKTIEQLEYDLEVAEELLLDAIFNGTDYWHQNCIRRVEKADAALAAALAA